MENNTNSKVKFASDTSQRTLIQWAKALAVLLLGLIIAHLGVSLFLLSEAGTDTFTVFVQGLSLKLNLSVGTTHVIVTVILMVLMLIFTTGYVKPGTAVCAFCGGPIIDFFSNVFKDVVNGSSPLWVRGTAVILGLVILSLGMSIVINSRAGTGPNDLVAIILCDKIGKLPFRAVRIMCDIFFVLLGWLLGGTVGIGTLIAVVLTGPVVQFFLPRTDKLCRKIIND